MFLPFAHFIAKRECGKFNFQSRSAALPSFHAAGRAGPNTTSLCPLDNPYKTGAHLLVCGLHHSIVKFVCNPKTRISTKRIENGPNGSQQTAIFRRD